MAILLREIGRPRAKPGCLKNRSAGARSTSRPWCRNRISSPSRRAWPRLCVTITILVPAACSAPMTLSISCVAPGSRLAVGSSRNSTSGRSAQTRASASRCCSPPESTRAGWSAHALRGRPCAAPRPRALVAFPDGNAGELQRIGDVGERRAAQQHRALEHHRLAPRSARDLGRVPGDRSGRSAEAGRGRGAAARSCPRRSGRRSPCAARVESSARCRR